MTTSPLESVPIPTPIDTSSQFSADPSDVNHPPYDAWVLAGGRLFRAHTNVLCAHSPYLRASISALGEARLLLPHVPASGFSAVLTFMYTGRLCLTQVPVYEILLTGHLLQMPSVVGLCQALLATPSSTNPFSLLNYESTSSTDSLPPALNAWRNLARLVPSAADLSTPMQNHATLVRPTPTRLTDAVSLEKITKVAVAQAERRSIDLNDKRSLLDVGRFVLHQFKKVSVASLDQETSTNYKTSNGNNIIVDVAACDGPVFFERVINKAFKNNSDQENLTDSDESEINVVDTTMTANDPTTFDEINLDQEFNKCSRPQLANGCRTYHCVYCNNTFKSHYCYQKHMRRHINPITIEENSQRILSDKEMLPLDQVCHSKNSSEQCERPVTKDDTPMSIVDSNARTGQLNDDCSTSSAGSSTNRDKKDEKLRVLDLNVQYFPCKTCGSKFPSYYFVHKHRRLCHADEEDEEAVVKDTSSCSSQSNDGKEREPVANQ